MSSKLTLEQFVQGLHKSSKLLSRGTATVKGRKSQAILLKNIYGQELVWGMFGHSRGKFKGFLANNANTTNVGYTSECDKHNIKYSPPFGDFDEDDPIPPMPSVYYESKKWLKQNYNM